MKPTFFDRMRLAARTGQAEDMLFWSCLVGAAAFFFDQSTEPGIDALLASKPDLHGDLPFERIFIEDERDDRGGFYVEKEGPRAAKVWLIRYLGGGECGAEPIGSFDASLSDGVDAVTEDGVEHLTVGETCRGGAGVFEEIREFLGGDIAKFDRFTMLIHVTARLNLLALPPSLVERDELDVRTINRKRRLMRRPPISAKTIVRLKPGAERLIAERLQGGHHEPCRPLHAVRGHLRRLKSGKITHVRPHRRGDARFGVRLAEYRVSGPGPQEPGR